MSRALALALVASSPLALWAQSPYVLTERVSVTASGSETALGSWAPSSSQDGRFVAFWSDSPDLVPGDTNGVADVFVRDLVAGTIERVSVGAGGVESNGASTTPAISADGRYVAFRSAATNLFFFLDTNGVEDIYLRDRQAGVTERISEDSFGFQVMGASKEPSISADGRYVVFTSDATNLVVGDANGASDVFRKDRQTGLVELVSAAPGGMSGWGASSAADVSPDGQWVAFESLASDLVPGDLNGTRDVFLRDMTLGKTERVSEDAAGTGGNGKSFAPAVSMFGHFVAFQSLAMNFVPGNTNAAYDVFRWQRSTGELVPVSTSTQGALADGDSYTPSISDDGSSVAFQSAATNLVPGDTNGFFDLFVKDLQTGLCERASTNIAGVEADGGSYQADLCGDGSHVAFSSEAANLVAGDSNLVGDVFRYDLMTGGATMTLTNVIANSTVTIGVTGATPASTLVVGWSLLGTGPTPSAWGPISLSPPILALPLATDGGGAASIDFDLPSALLGFTLAVQGVDLATDYPTSAAWAVIEA